MVEHRLKQLCVRHGLTGLLEQPQRKRSANYVFPQSV